MADSNEQKDAVQNVQVRMPVELHGELKQRARADDLSVSQTVRRAVKQYLRQGAPA